MAMKPVIGAGIGGLALLLAASTLESADPLPVLPKPDFSNTFYIDVGCSQ